MGKIDVLKQTALFADVPLAYFPKIMDKFEIIEIPPETEVFHEGDTGDCLYIIEDGELSVVVNIEGIGKEEVAILEKFDILGEMAVLDDSPRSATIIAKKGAKLLKLNKADFQVMLEEPMDISNIILHNLILRISKRIRATSDKLNSFYLMEMSI